MVELSSLLTLSILTTTIAAPNPLSMFTTQTFEDKEEEEKKKEERCR
jgi:hypothetical protein